MRESKISFYNKKLFYMEKGVSAVCLAIPGTIIKIENGEGVIDYGGISRRAELVLVPEAKVGDRVIVHAGFAISLLDKEAGDELIELTKEAGLRG